MALAGGLLRERYSALAAIEVWQQKKLVGRINSGVRESTTLEPLLKVPKPITKTGND